MDVTIPDWDYEPVGPFAYLSCRQSDGAPGLHIPHLPNLTAACICYLDNAIPPQRGRMVFITDAFGRCVVGYAWPIDGPAMPAWMGCAAAFAKFDGLVDADYRFLIVEWELCASGHFDGLELGS